MISTPIPSLNPYTPDHGLTTEVEQLRAEKQHLEAIVREQQARIAHEQQRWQFALEGVGDAIWEYNLQTGEIFRSARFHAILGYTPSEFPNTMEAWEERLHPNDRHAQTLPGLDAYRSGARESHRTEYRLRAKDGSYKHFLDRGRLFSWSDDGKPLLVIGTSTDITVQKTLEETLRRDANRQRNLIANLQAGILFEDEQRAIVLVNQHFCDLFAIPATPDQLQGMDCSGMAEQSKHTFKDPALFEERVSRLLLDQKPVIGEEMELADGRIFERDYVPLFMDGVYAGHLWRYADITSRKRSETLAIYQKEKYQRIIENMNLGLIEVDLDDRIVYTNQSFCDMSGYEYDELVGNIATDILLKGQNVEFMRQKNNSRVLGMMDAYEIAIKNKRGEAMWWLVSGAPLYSGRGEVVGSTGIHLDITNQKQLESDLRIAKQEAEHSSQAKELFLANMSHEIRTPMNAILSLGQLLMKTALTSHQRFLLGMINTAGSNLLVILNDILDFSKIEAGQLALEHIGFDMTELLERAVQVMTYKAAEKKLALTLVTDPTLVPVLIGDPYRLNQILLNLLSNAIKFTETGRVTIRCSCQQQQTQQLVNITVADTGIGIEPDYLQKLFTKFTQEDGSIVRRYGGTGLGMSITKQLIDLMGGTIEVTSEKNQGTTVTVRIAFPVGTRSDLPVAEQEVEEQDVLNGKRILLVEDNTMNRLIVTTILKPYGVVVTEVTNGLSAVEAFQTDTFDLILMDVQMPVMDGLEASRIIRSTASPQIPIIALTASAIRKEEEACYTAGMNDFLAKPFQEQNLISKLTKWLREGVLPAAPGETAEPLCDLSNLETISRGNPAFVQRMIDLFCSETPTSLDQIQAAYATQDYKKIKHLAHRMKPSIDNLNIVSQQDSVRQIEQLASSGQDSDELRTLLTTFDETLRAVIRHMQQRG